MIYRPPALLAVGLEAIILPHTLFLKHGFFEDLILLAVAPTRSAFVIQCLLCLFAILLAAVTPGLLNSTESVDFELGKNVKADLIGIISA